MIIVSTVVLDKQTAKLLNDVKFRSMQRIIKVNITCIP